MNNIKKYRIIINKKIFYKINLNNFLKNEQKKIIHN